MGILGRYFRMSHRQVEDVLTPGRRTYVYVSLMIDSHN
jgi:hypothetical protein